MHNCYIYNSLVPGPTSTTPHSARQMSPTTPSPRPGSVSVASVTSVSSCAEQSRAESRGEVGSVTAAVNTLNNIHEFALDLHNGNYDSGYGGLQPVTDSLLSGEIATSTNFGITNS